MVYNKCLRRSVEISDSSSVVSRSVASAPPGKSARNADSWALPQTAESGTHEGPPPGDATATGVDLAFQSRMTVTVSVG